MALARAVFGEIPPLNSNSNNNNNSNSNSNSNSNNSNNSNNSSNSSTANYNTNSVTGMHIHAGAGAGRTEVHPAELLKLLLCLTPLALPSLSLCIKAIQRGALPRRYAAACLSEIKMYLLTAVGGGEKRAVGLVDLILRPFYRSSNGREGEGEGVEGGRGGEEEGEEEEEERDRREGGSLARLERNQNMLLCLDLLPTCLSCLEPEPSTIGIDRHRGGGRGIDGKDDSLLEQLQMLVLDILNQDCSCIDRETGTGIGMGRDTYRESRGRHREERGGERVDNNRKEVNPDIKWDIDI